MSGPRPRLLPPGPRPGSPGAGPGTRLMPCGPKTLRPHPALCNGVPQSPVPPETWLFPSLGPFQSATVSPLSASLPALPRPLHSPHQPPPVALNFASPQSSQLGEIPPRGLSALPPPSSSCLVLVPPKSSSPTSPGPSRSRRPSVLPARPPDPSLLQTLPRPLSSAHTPAPSSCLCSTSSSWTPPPTPIKKNHYDFTDF